MNIEKAMGVRVEARLGEANRASLQVLQGHEAGALVLKRTFPMHRYQ